MYHIYTCVLFVDFISNLIFFCMHSPKPSSKLFPYTTLFRSVGQSRRTGNRRHIQNYSRPPLLHCRQRRGQTVVRSEEHTSELQSHSDLVCRLLLEKKKIIKYIILHC